MILRAFKMQLLQVLLIICVPTLTVSANSDELSSVSVNLALRQVGHKLLIQQSDSTSSIPPIEYIGNNGYLLPIKKVIQYNALPELLTDAFEDFNITRPYEVVIKNCDDDIIILGYNSVGLEQGVIPCINRDHAQSCVNILVQFYNPSEENVKHASTFFPFWLIPILLIGFGFLVYKFLWPTTEEKENSLVTLGQYSYDPKNQTLSIKEEKFNLTFRENKLLQLLASKPNEVLTRDEIMSKVWTDEGVIVGRSLDVFISRIRKLLKQDPSIQIKSVHGVGYRMETGV